MNISKNIQSGACGYIGIGGAVIGSGTNIFIKNSSGEAFIGEMVFYTSIAELLGVSSSTKWSNIVFSNAVLYSRNGADQSEGLGWGSYIRIGISGTQLPWYGTTDGNTLRNYIDRDTHAGTYYFNGGNAAYSYINTNIGSLFNSLKDRSDANTFSIQPNTTPWYLYTVGPSWGTGTGGGDRLATLNEYVHNITFDVTIENGIYRYNGTTWEECIPYIYTNNNWQEVIPQIYRNSSW